MTWSWSAFTSGGRPPAWVSKVISTCVEQCFDEKPSFRKINNFCISLDIKCRKWCFVVSLFITSGQWAKNLEFFGEKDWAASSKMHSTFCRRYFEDKIHFWEKPNVLFFLGYSASTFLDMDEKFSIALLELHSTCLANVLTKLDFLNFLLQLSGFERKEVWLLLVISGVIVGTTIYVFRSSLWEKIFFGRIIFVKVVSGSLTEKIGTFDGNFSGRVGVVGTTIYLSRRSFQKRYVFGWIVFWNLILDLEWKWLGIFTIPFWKNF